MSRPSRRFGRIFVVALVFSMALGGCVAARGEVVYGDPVVYVGRPPFGYYGAPHAYYHGRPAYFVDGSWYYDSPGGWVMFRREPRVLYEHRVYSYSGPRPGYGPPPPRVYRAPRVSAPPPRVYRAPRASSPPPRVYAPPPRAVPPPRPAPRAAPPPRAYRVPPAGPR